LLMLGYDSVESERRYPMSPKCPHCKSTEYTAVTRTRGGVTLIILVCKNCEVILGCAAKP